jgi:hypothetical protein
MNKRLPILLCLLLIGLNGCDDTTTKNKNPDQPTFVTGSAAINSEEWLRQNQPEDAPPRLGPDETRLLGMWAPTKRVVIPEVISGRKVTEIVNFAEMMSGGSKGSKKPSYRFGDHVVSPFGSGAGSPRPRNNITEEIVIPGTVKKIRGAAFRECRKLKKITFSEGLVEIEDYAFEHCNQLEAVEFPRSLRRIGKSAFNDCDKLHSIVFKEGVETIGDHAFSKTSPKKVTFPKSLKSLGLVFQDCRGLEAIIFLGDSPVAHSKRKEISKRAPSTVYYDPQTKGWDKAGAPIGYKGGRKTIEELPIKGEIHDYGYKDGGAVLYRWHADGEVVIPELIQGVPVTAIGNDAFSGNAFIKKVSLPFTVREIQSKAFKHCKNLARLNLPPSLEMIGREAFWGCTNLSAITLPPLGDFNPVIGRSAFPDKVYEKAELEGNSRLLGAIITGAADVKALEDKKLQRRGEKGEELYYATNQQTPYTGWSKGMFQGNKQTRRLDQYKDGKVDGLVKLWYRTGRKRSEAYWKDGKMLTIVVWKPNGDKCPVTKVVNGNGVRAWYKDDGTESFRVTIKDGVKVED